MIGGSSPDRGWKFFSPLPRPDRLWDPPSLLSSGYQGPFPWGVKRQGREADHSPPFSAEVKEWVELYLNFPNTHTWCGAQLKEKHGNSFTFLPFTFDGGSAYRKASTYTGQRNAKKIQTYVHASSGIRAYDPSVRAVQVHSAYDLATAGTGVMFGVE
jgi:hypothetical protein